MSISRRMRGIGAVSAGIFLVVALTFSLSVAGDADAAHFKLHRGSHKGQVSAFEFRTTKNRVKRVFVRAEAKCDTGHRISWGASFGRPGGLPGTKRIRIRSNGRFSVNYEDRNVFGGGAIKMKGRVFKKRIRGRVSYRWFDNYFDDLCWTGKSVKKSWVRFSAKRLRPGTPWEGEPRPDLKSWVRPWFAFGGPGRHPETPALPSGASFVP